MQRKRVRVRIQETQQEPVQLMLGDCREVMKTLADASVDAIVCDPPYELGFMGRAWDKSGIANDVRVREQAFRVLKPGGHLLAFGGTRTYHRMVCAVEDAGFGIRDQIGWACGTGFPKSLDVSKAIDKAAGAKREQVAPRSVISHQRNIGNRRPYMDNPNHTTDSDEPATEAARQWQGWGTALKPTWEPIVVARKPLIGTVAANVMAHGTGALNISGCLVPSEDNLNGGAYSAARQISASPWAASGSLHESTGKDFVQPDGRWPANIIHDSSEEVLARFPNNAARFFYCAKAGRADRGDGNTHETVKPLELMRYLCRLVTPPGGLVLDPFMGSGTTMKAALMEGFRGIGIDLHAKHLDIARSRLSRTRVPLTV